MFPQTRTGILLLLAILLVVGSDKTFARQLSADEALQIARSHHAVNIGTSQTRVGKPASNGSLRLVHTALMKNDIPAFYVFDRSNDNGFIIISGDDRFREVLGKADCGTFKPDSIPENMKWWLTQYEQEMEAYLNSPAAQTTVITAVPVAKANSSWAPIPQMLTTKWDQLSPYNDLCPTDNNRRCVTGCVATAMAQVMNYHKWPQQGTGSVSYHSVTGLDVSCDFSSITFDWENMLDTYNSYSSAQSRQAVAQLMFACGASIYMNYGTGMSSSYSYNIPYALIDNFGYDTGTHTIDRKYYSSEEWEGIIYNELAANRPVIYGGVANIGGHQFVCDGYSGDGMFHFNWGWGGVSDGDFALTALNPGQQGTGGYEGGYNSEQSIVVGMQKNQGGAKIYNLQLDGGFRYEDESFRFTGNIYAYPERDINAAIGIMVVPDNNANASYCFESQYVLPFTAFNRIEGIGAGYAPFSYTATPTGLEAGSYKVYPAYKTDDSQWTRLRGLYGEQQYVELTVGANGELTYTNPGGEVEADITMLEFSPMSKVYRNTKTDFKLSVKNNASATYSGTIELDFKKPGYETVLARELIQLDVAAGKVLTGKISLTIDFEPGEYSVTAKDKNGEVISPTDFHFTIEDGVPEVPEADLWISEITPTEFYEGYYWNPTLTITNSTPDAISTTLTIKAYDKGGTQALSSISTSSISFQSNTTTSLTIRGYYPEVPMGNYELQFFNSSDEPISDRLPVSEYGRIGSYWYGKTEDGNGVNLVKGPEAYTTVDGLIEIPASVTINGTAYPVKQIMKGAFVSTNGIGDIMLHPAAVLFDNPVFIFGALTENVNYYVNSATYDNYTSILGNNPVYAIVDNLIISPATVPDHFKPGDTFNFDLIFSPSDHATYNFDTSSFDPNVVSLKANGMNYNGFGYTATMLSEGSTTITFTAKQPGTPVSASIEFNIVEDVKVSEIILSRTSLEMNEGQTETLIATVSPENATDRTVTWSSDNTAVATVDASGTVTAINAGIANITASAGEVSTVCTVTVKENLGIEKVGIESIEASTICDVFTADGRMILKQVTFREFKEKLTKGFYIVTANGKAYKLTI